MKHFTRLNVYKASNVHFCPETFRAFSYNWWRFVDKINGKIVFNSYRYSPSTGGHQSKVRSLLSNLGIKIDFEIECPKGFQDLDYIESIENHYTSKIEDLKALIDKPRSQTKKNIERKEEIKELNKLVTKFKKAIK